MDAFQILRKQAADKRDAIIAAAKAEYSLAKKRINALRTQLGAAAPEAPPIKFRRIVDVIADNVPHDAPFTVGELMEIMLKAEPGRRITQSTLRTCCQRLEQSKVLRKVGRRKGLTLWAAADFKGRVDLAANRRLPELAEEVLKATGPLRVSDLFNRIIERGYRTDDSKKKVLQALRTALWRCRQFERDKSGKWSVVG